MSKVFFGFVEDNVKIRDCGTSKKYVTITLKVKYLVDVGKVIDKLEEGFEGCAVEFCEKHGDASYTGFKECLKEIRTRLSLVEESKSLSEANKSE